jgi:hypothetical protein
MLLTGLLLPVAGAQELKLGSDTALSGENVELPLTLSSPDPVEGMEVAFEWDGARGTGVDLTPGPALADADTVQVRVGADFMAMGVVMDSDGQDDEVIPDGNDQLLATAVIECAGSAEDTPVEFADGKYAVAEGGPELDNIIVVGGQSIGAGDGLTLTAGSFSCEQPATAYELKLGSDTAVAGQNVELPLTLSSTDPVEGMEVAFEWDGARGSGVDLERGPALADADTVEVRVGADFMAMGVVMDSDGQDGEILPAGNDQLLATAVIECSGAAADTPVEFVDGKHAVAEGGPELDNIVVVDGQSIGAGDGLTLTAGSFSCEQPAAEYELKLGSDTAVSGQNAELPLTLSSSEPVQGLEVVFEWDEARGTGLQLDIAPLLADADTVQARIEAGFMVLGVVVDIDGQGEAAIPPGDDQLLATAVIGCSGAADETPVEFVDGKHGMTADGPPLNNIVVVGGESIGADDGLTLTSGSFRCREPGGVIQVAFDIKPGGCPSPLNTNSRGVLPAAILGTEDFDVTQIDVATIELEGVAPLRSSLEDVATPFDLAIEDCMDCSAEGRDGFLDLTLKFSNQEIVAALGEVLDRECRVLQVTGSLLEEFGATPIEGEAVVRIQDRATRSRGRMRAMQRDANGDGRVDLGDPIASVRYLFGGEAPSSPGAADSNGDGKIDTGDVVDLLWYMFR